MSENNVHVQPWRLESMKYVLLAICLVIFAWTIHFQFLPEAADLKREGDLYHGVWLPIDPPRGLIYDRNGNLIAGNKIVYEVGIELQFKGTPEAIARVLNATLGIDYQEALEAVNIEYDEKKAVYAVVQRGVPSEQAEELNAILVDWAENYNGRKDEDSLRGVVMFPYLARTYPEKTTGSNMLGFVNAEGNGFYGLEQRYDNVLSGVSREVFIPANPNYASELPDIPPGSTLLLTIDREVQAMVEQELDAAMDKFEAESASAVILDPKTGEIIAMATSPRLDINEFWRFKEVFPGATPFNRPLSQTFEPGSVMKVFSMASAVEMDAVQLDTVFFDTGYFDYGGIVVQNWDRLAHGEVNMIGCLQHSLNVCLAWVGTQMGADNFYNYMDAFGFGRYTGVDLAGESTGRLKEPGDSDWYPADLVTNTFGQGVSVTALQIAAAAGALANGGDIMVPHVVKAFIDNGVKVDVGPVVLRSPISAETADAMTEALAISLETESSLALVKNYRVAGKTGTAEIPGGDGYLENETNVSFLGYGPVEDPRFVVYVWLEQPSPAGGSDTPWGSEIAAPVFSSIVDRLVVLMKIPPDHVREQLGMTEIDGN
ncbi:MAG TPA: penicillin-binding protein 2 [Anaerolineales bacterium]|nr:penicillin-binding protein 2 [Anaerolineales bacterium]